LSSARRFDSLMFGLLVELNDDKWDVMWIMAKTGAQNLTAIRASTTLLVAY